MVALDREAFHRAIDEMTDEELAELRVTIVYMKHQKTHPGSAWFRTMYELFAPVREAIAETDMSEEEINQAIDEAIDEVRRERST